MSADYKVTFRVPVKTQGMNDPEEARRAALVYLYGDLIERHFSRSTIQGSAEFEAMRTNFVREFSKWFERVDREP